MDKWYHVVSGTLIFLGCMYMQFADWVSLLWVVLAGIVKEVYDHYHKGSVEWLDFVATISFPVFLLVVKLIFGLYNA